MDDANFTKTSNKRIGNTVQLPDVLVQRNVFSLLN